MAARRRLPAVPQLSVELLDLRIALNKLDAGCPWSRAIVELYYVDGRTLEEIASHMNLTAKTVNVFRQKAMIYLRHLLIFNDPQSHH